jgi:hypothetical protein
MKKTTITENKDGTITRVDVSTDMVQAAGPIALSYRGIKRTTKITETGRALMLVAKPRRKLCIRNGVLCPRPCHGSQAHKRLFLRLPDAPTPGPETFVDSAKEATLLAYPENSVPRIVEMLLINTDACSHIEVGNTKVAQRINLPRATQRQLVSLKARAKADRTGRPQPVAH